MLDNADNVTLMAVLFSELFEDFESEFNSSIATSALDPYVVGFKSVACYRTGLDISISSKSSTPQIVGCLDTIFKRYISQGEGDVRIEDKAFNDFVVCSTLTVAARHNKPGKARSVFICLFLTHLM